MLIIGAIVIGAAGIFFIWRQRKKAPAEDQQQQQQQELVTLPGKVIASPYLYAYHPCPDCPGSDISYRYGTRTGIYNSFSPYNVYGIPTGLVQQGPGTTRLVGTGTTVYYYAADRVPDFLLNPDQQANLDQTRLEESYWPPSRYGSYLFGGP